MAKPIRTNQNITPCTPTSSECVIWDNPNLPECIELCHGDSVSDIIVKVANAVCDIKTSTDIVTITADCEFFPIGEGSPTPTTISGYINALIEGWCYLYEYVHDLNNFPTGDGGTLTYAPFDVNLKPCFIDITGTSVPTGGLSNSQIIQLILDTICKIDAKYAKEIDELKITISMLGSGGGGGSTDPIVFSDCLFVGGLTLSAAWVLLDAEWCEYKSHLGDITDFDDLETYENSVYGTINADLGLTLTASTNIADSTKNLWEIAAELSSQVSSLQSIINNCCSFSCKNFEVTVNTQNYDEAAQTVDLRFLFNDSLTLPDPPYTFANTIGGSSVTLTDITGYSITYSIDPFTTNPLTGISLVGLDLSGDVTISITLTFDVTEQSGALRTFSCSKCLSLIFRSNSGCAYCDINITLLESTNAEIIIIYTVPGDPVTTNTLTITQSGTYIIPSNATVVSITDVNNNGVVILSNNCPNLTLPDVQTLACYSFVIDEDFYDEVSGSGFAYYYKITGFMIDGNDVVTYSPGVRCDLSDQRGSVSEAYPTTEAECDFNSLGTTVLMDSYTKLNNINSNSYIFGNSKVCCRMYDDGGTDKLVYTNVIMRAVSGKNIFMKLTPESGNDLGINHEVEVYIKGVEIPQGEDCDCCYVYDGS